MDQQPAPYRFPGSAKRQANARWAAALVAADEAAERAAAERAAAQKPLPALPPLGRSSSSIYSSSKDSEKRSDSSEWQSQPHQPTWPSSQAKAFYPRNPMLSQQGTATKYTSHTSSSSPSTPKSLHSRSPAFNDVPIFLEPRTYSPHRAFRGESLPSTPEETNATGSRFWENFAHSPGSDNGVETIDETTSSYFPTVPSRGPESENSSNFPEIQEKRSFGYLGLSYEQQRWVKGVPSPRLSEDSTSTDTGLVPAPLFSKCQGDPASGTVPSTGEPMARSPTSPTGGSNNPKSKLDTRFGKSTSHEPKTTSELSATDKQSSPSSISRIFHNLWDKKEGSSPSGSTTGSLKLKLKSLSKKKSIDSSQKRRDELKASIKYLSAKDPNDTGPRDGGPPIKDHWAWKGP